jgi:hypothetical protein
LSAKSKTDFKINPSGSVTEFSRGSSIRIFDACIQGGLAIIRLNFEGYLFKII